MSDVFPKSNLPESSQPWGREIQKTVESLQEALARQSVNSSTSDTQLQASYRRIDETLNGLLGLGNADSPFSINADNVNAGSINGNVVSVTNLNAANLTSGTISSARINSNSISAATIGAGQITSGTISSDRISTSSLDAADINASRISAGTLTGSTIQTASSGKRVVLNNSTNAIEFYGTTGLSGAIDGLTPLGNNLEISGPGQPGLTIGTSGTTFEGKISSTAVTGSPAHIYAGERLGQSVFSAITGTNQAVFRSSTAGNNFGLFTPSTSDLRLKKDILELENSLELINNLRPVKFRFKSEEDGPVSYGLIAQEVKPFFDDNDNVVNEFLVEEEEESYYSVEYNAFIAPLIGAVKELTQKNLDLEARIAILEDRV